MRDGLWTKGLVFGIIMLFVGTSVLPSISGNLRELTKSDSNSINQISHEKTSFDNDLNSPKTLGLTDGLVGYWDFNEGSGTIAHDNSGNGYHGNINGATWTKGKYGSALEITNTSYVGDIPSSYDDSITTAFTVAVWVKWYGPSSYPHDCVIFDGRADEPNGFIFAIQASTGKLLFHHMNQGGSSVLSTSTIPTGSWTHVAAVFDDTSNVYRFYINGHLDNFITNTFSYLQSTSNAMIGNNHWAPGDGQWAPINGIEDEVRIYNRALSADEILELYNLSGNIPPVPFFTWTPEYPNKNIPITFDASTSYDPDGTISQYEWFFGDGTNSSGVIVNHTFVDSGVFPVNLTVTDNNGAKGSLIRNITIYRDQPDLIIQKITGGFGVSAVIKNNGTAAAADVSWSIDISGGWIILSGDHTEGTIDELAVGASTTIKAKPRGIGPVTITVQAGDASKQATGFLLGPLVLRVNQ